VLLLGLSIVLAVTVFATGHAERGLLKCLSSIWALLPIGALCIAIVGIFESAVSLARHEKQASFITLIANSSLALIVSYFLWIGVGI
jgi:hypothetical protein